MLISDLINVRYLSGFSGSNGALLVFADERDAVLATDGRYRTQAASQAPDTVQHDLESARSRLTGTFLDAYTQLTHDVVIPGAQQKQISAVATVAAAASVSTSADRAVVLLFVNQTITVGKDAPTTAASSVRVTLDNINGRWLISQFEPI